MSYSINVVYEIRRHVFTSEKTILNKKNVGKGSYTVTVLEKQFSSHHKEVQGSDTDKRGSNYELVALLGCKISAN